MFTDFLITLRETLEAALVVGIVLSYLIKIGMRGWFSTVYWAVLLGVLVSVAVAFLFEIYLGGFEGTTEEIYEGVIMILAALLLSWMILWMLRERYYIAHHLREKIDQHVQSERKIAVFFLVFVAVLREGIETVLFLKASAIQAGGNELLGAGLGVMVAIIVGYLLFTGLKKLPMQKFFTVTSVLLILFAAGLLAHGIHELQEAGVITVGAEEAWDVNPSVEIEGVYPLLHEKGTIGGLAKHVFGWNGNPSLLEVISYAVYLIMMVSLGRWMARKPADITAS